MKRRLISTISFIVLLIIWLIISYGMQVKEIFLPSPLSVLKAFRDMYFVEGIMEDLWASLSRILGGFILAMLIAIPLGMLMGISGTASAMFEPLISFIRYMPASAFIPMFIIWFGLGEIEKMAVIFYGTFFYLTLMVMDVAKNVDETLIEASKTLGFNKFQLFTKVIFRASMPGIVDALRTCFGAAWTYLIIAEIVGADSGLGYMIQNSSRYLKTNRMFVGIITIGLLGLISDKLFELFSKKVFAYQNKNK